MNLEGLKTYIGIGIAMTPTIATLFGYETTPNFEGDATEIAFAFLTLAGGAIAFYGRLMAKIPGLFAKS